MWSKIVAGIADRAGLPQFTTHPLRHLPKSRADRQELAETIGKDGVLLLNAVFDASTPSWLREIPALRLFRRIWVQNYRYEDGQLHWRSIEDIPPSTISIGSPYDCEARYSKKRSTTWVGDTGPFDRNL